MCVHLLAKMDSSEEAKDRFTSSTMGWCLLPFWPPRSLSAHSWQGLLDVENEEYVVSLFFAWAGLSSFLPLLLYFVLEYMFTGDKVQLLCLGPIYLLPQEHEQRNGET